MVSEKRKLLKATIADLVKRHGCDLTKDQQKIRAKQVLNLFDGDAWDIFDSDPTKNIPAIIEFTYEYQLDTTTSHEISDKAEQLRGLALKAATLEDGIKLGMALERFLYEAGPESEAVRKKQRINAGANDARAKKNKRYQERDDRIIEAAKAMFKQKPGIKTKQVRDKLMVEFTENTIEQTDITREQMYRLVLIAKRELKMRSRP